MPTTNLLNPQLLTIEELVDNIQGHSEDLSAYYSAIDRKIVKVCRDEQVLPDDIPVDGSGFITSIALTEMAVNYGIAIILRGYTGSGAGNRQDVYNKYEHYWGLYELALQDVTYEEITGGSPNDDLIPPVHQVDSSFVAYL